MAWRRGFWRLWVVGTACWAVLWIIVLIAQLTSGNAIHWDTAPAAVVVVFVVPVLALALGHGILWALEGFGRR